MHTPRYCQDCGRLKAEDGSCYTCDAEEFYEKEDDTPNTRDWFARSSEAWATYRAESGHGE